MVSPSQSALRAVDSRHSEQPTVARRAPRGLTFECVYEPDFERQVAALTLLLGAVYAVAESPKSMAMGDTGTSLAGGAQCAE